jgi:hypothetical protein
VISTGGKFEVEVRGESFHQQTISKLVGASGNAQTEHAAVLVSHDDLGSLEETLAIMSDPTLMAQIYQSEQTDTTNDPAATFAELRAGLHSRSDAAA